MKKWKTIVALFFMGFAIYFNWGWFWALFILLGLVHVVKSGEVNFVERITKAETPRLYWTMIVIWSFLALYSMASYLTILM